MGKDTRKMMLQWADIIILLHEKCQEGVAEEYWGKLKILQVGQEHEYFKEPDKRLVKILTDYIKREGL